MILELYGGAWYRYPICGWTHLDSLHLDQLWGSVLTTIHCTLLLRFESCLVPSRTSLPRGRQQLLELLRDVELSSHPWTNLRPHLVPSLGLQLPLKLLQDVRCPNLLSTYCVSCYQDQSMNCLKKKIDMIFHNMSSLEWSESITFKCSTNSNSVEGVT